MGDRTSASVIIGFETTSFQDLIFFLPSRGFQFSTFLEMFDLLLEYNVIPAFFLSEHIAYSLRHGMLFCFYPFCDIRMVSVLDASPSTVTTRFTARRVSFPPFLYSFIHNSAQSPNIGASI